MLTHLYTDIDAFGGGFHLDVENGSKPDDHKCDHLSGMKTQVMLTCNSSVKWTGQDISEIFHIVSVDFFDRCEVAYSIHAAVSNTILCYCSIGIVIDNIDYVTVPERIFYSVP